ncbi:MAG: HAMP domain-containing sensor histidine kinase [Planctomycetota bacterium]
MTSPAPQGPTPTGGESGTALSLRLAAHELKTPLAALSGAAEILSDTQSTLSDEDRQLVQIIHRNARRMQGLIDDILLLGRLDRGDPRCERTPVCLGSVVAPIVRRFAHVRGITRTFVAAPALDDVHLMTDGAHLSRVLEALIDNAGKFASLRVEIELERDDEEIRIVVQDDGIGVPEVEREEIFARFQRNPRGRDVGGGAGLGLALARDLARAIGADLRCEGSPRGARFVVAFPATDEA